MISFAILSFLLAVPEPRGPVAVVATSKRPGTEAYGSKVATRALELLKREGVANLFDEAQTLKLLKEASFPDPRSCNGGQKCVEKLAVLMGPRAVIVSIDVAKIGKSLAIHVEALGAEGGEPLSSTDVSAPIDSWKEQSALGFITFARALKDRLETAAPAPPEPASERPASDRPVAAVTAPTRPSIEPSSTENTTELRDEAIGGKPVRTGAWVAVAGSTTAFVLSGILVGLGVADQDTIRSRTTVVVLEDGKKEERFNGLDAEYRQIQTGGNLKFTLALTSALIGAALAATSTWLFLKD